MFKESNKKVRLVEVHYLSHVYGRFQSINFIIHALNNVTIINIINFTFSGI